MPKLVSWSGYFKRSSTAIFVISGRTGRLRYVNPAWEALTGRSLAQVRGTKIASQRRSSSPFWRALTPPSESYQGQVSRVRRAVPPGTVGPPWWEIDFMPLAENDGLLGILGRITPVGEPLRKGQPRWGDWLAELQLQRALPYSLSLFEGGGIQLQRVLTQARQAAANGQPLWLEGEPGTGKKTLAHAIHNASPRFDHGLLAVDAAALKPYLLESLLFSPGGIAQANQLGTVYCREATRLPQELQARLLNWASRPNAPRLIFGSTVPSDIALNAGLLLPAFYTRFTAQSIRLPPLREQLADLPRWTSELLRRLGQTEPLPEAVLELLALHRWPGNFRELQDLLASIAQQPADQLRLPRHLQELKLHASPPVTLPRQPLDVTLGLIENQLVRLALKRHPDKPNTICDELGITRARLNKITTRLNSGEV